VPPRALFNNGRDIPLFAAGHGNLAGTPAVISEASVSAARLAMRTQTGIGGERLGMQPRYLVVGPALETVAEKFLATTTGEVNPFAGQLTLMVEPRITGSGWYLFAAPGQMATFELAHLAGVSGPVISMRDGWTTLDREFRVVLDFGVGVLDHRGAFRNAGV